MRLSHGRRAASCTAKSPALFQATSPVDDRWNAAQHWELAGEPRSAVQTLLGAAQSARMRGNIGRAASLGLAALSIAEKHQELAGTRSTLVLPVLHDLFRAGRWTEVTPLAREAWTRRDADFERDRAAIANILGLSLFYLGAVQEAADLVNGEVDRLYRNSDTPGAALLTSERRC
jgi:hypothetical protein